MCKRKLEMEHFLSRGTKTCIFSSACPVFYVFLLTRFDIFGIINTTETKAEANSGGFSSPFAEKHFFEDCRTVSSPYSQFLWIVFPFLFFGVCFCVKVAEFCE